MTDGVHAFDAENVIIMGFQDTAAKTQGIMRTSSDGGEHWSNDTVIDPGAWITGTVQFADPVHGFTLAALAGRGHATSDAGAAAATRVDFGPGLAVLAHHHLAQRGVQRATCSLPSARPKERGKKP